MSWTLLLCLIGILGFALAVALSRRAELRRMNRVVRERERAVRQGADKAQLQHPVIDLSRCLGCGTCVAVCPEDGVLELVHGQAQVVNGARCMGVAACERECPVGAITVTLGKLEERDDVPALSPDLEAIGTEGLFLAGEVTAHALIKTAVEHGAAVGAEVARRIERDRQTAAAAERFDLVIVGAGPAGLACALEARRHGLDAVVLEQETELGGTVAKYPRQKLVLSEPVTVPLHGRIKRRAYSKEELMAMWRAIATEHELPIEYGQVYAGLEREADGGFVVHTTQGESFPARYVCLAIGRRGVPQKLGVPGEELPKVAYSLLDAQSYQGRRVLVVGGGDSAVETALALAEQPGNDVTLAYRKESFFRIRSRNEERLREGLAAGSLRVLYRSEVVAIGAGTVTLAQEGGDRSGSALRTARRLELANDDVFIMAGGTPVIGLLQESGVSFDPGLREQAAPIGEQGSGLWAALGVAFALALLALGWALWHGDYYLLPEAQRATHPKHTLLRPGLGIGLWAGVAAVALVGLNLLYLLRRAPRFPLALGSLRAWMTSHVATGILAFLAAVLHSAMAPGNSPGGHALLALAVLLVTGAIGRYFYAWVPRAANGRELELTEARLRLTRIAEEWDAAHLAFATQARARVSALIEARQWRGSFLGRVIALFGLRFDLRRLTRQLAHEGTAQQIPPEQVEQVLTLARRAHRAALVVAHFEDLRAVMNTWRYLHRWVAALLVLLIVVHVWHAMTYGAFFSHRRGG